ncbi:GNAT family N-acetyltransferase [Candidatus Chlorohelix sp.]|uniref:GNAT family N-acetyltransferase n=1 Tax=Candidatus Chlorohelix sp. TaxID=3139201 RepID=UPI00305A8C89
MQMRLILKAYEPSHRDAVLKLWKNSVLNNLFSADGHLWKINVENNAAFKPADFWGAWNEQGILLGFVLTRRFRDITAPPVMVERYGKTGWISLLLVEEGSRKQGIGTTLLEKAHDALSDVELIRLGGDFSHFFPGVPEGEALEFFSNKGCNFNKELINDLCLSLDNWRLPEQPTSIAGGDYFFTQGKAGEEESILDFIGLASNGFSPRWHYDLERLFKIGYSPENITLIKSRSGKIEGFLQTWQAKEVIEKGLSRPIIFWAMHEKPKEKHGSIGPLGINSTIRGGGIGLALVAAGTEHLRKTGVTFATIDWTDLTAFYAKLGYQSWRSYKIGYKNL